MAANPPRPQMTILIFLKSLGTPVVLYSDNPAKLYEEIKMLIKNANPAAPKLVEKPGIGPLKKVLFLDTELVGAAVQADPSAPQQQGPAPGGPGGVPPQGPPRP